MGKIQIFIMSLALAAASPVAADVTFLYSFGSPGGPLGTSQAYTSHGVTVTAYGFNKHDLPNDLFGKNQGGDEVGLGLVGTSDKEVQTNNFIELDMRQFWAQHPQDVMLSIGSVQRGEKWGLYGSNKLGQRGVLLQSGTTNYPTTFGLTGLADSYKYLTLQAKSGDILLSTLSGKSTVGVPEPGTFLLLGTALALAKWRKGREKNRLTNT